MHVQGTGAEACIIGTGCHHHCTAAYWSRSALKVLEMALQGVAPPVSAALQLHHILTDAGTQLRVPVGLETQLKYNDVDSDVGKSMYQLLQVRLLAPVSMTTAQAKATWCIPNLMSLRHCLLMVAWCNLAHGYACSETGLPILACLWGVDV